MMGSDAQRGTAAGLDPRQFSRELQERMRDAQALRDEAARNGQDVRALDQAIAGMRSLGSMSPGDPRAAAMLREQVVEGLKAFEFNLRRSLDGNAVRVGRTGEVPDAYRRQVEEYYRSLGRSPK